MAFFFIIYDLDVCHSCNGFYGSVWKDVDLCMLSSGHGGCNVGWGESNCSRYFSKSLHTNHSSSSTGRGASQLLVSLLSCRSKSFSWMVIWATKPSGSDRLLMVASTLLQVNGFSLLGTGKVKVSFTRSQLSPRLCCTRNESMSKSRSLKSFA